MTKNKESMNKYQSLFLLLVGTILLVWGGSNLYKNYQEDKISKSYLSEKISNVQYNELKDAVVEFGEDTFIYISYTGDSKIHNFEVKMKKILTDNELIDKMLYLNVDKEKDNKNFIKELNELLKLEKNPIKKVPAIVYFNDVNPVETIDSSESMLDTGRFEQLLEKYEVVNQYE